MRESGCGKRAPARAATIIVPSFALTFGGNQKSHTRRSSTDRDRAGRGNTMQDRRTTTAIDPRAREATRRERTQRAGSRTSGRAVPFGAEERAETPRRREVVVQGMRISLPALRFLDDKAAPGP